MSVRVVPSAFALAALLLGVAGQRAEARLVLLAGVVAAAAAVLDAVTGCVVARSTRADVALAVATLGFVVAASALGVPALALGALPALVPRAPLLERRRRVEPALSK